MVINICRHALTHSDSEHVRASTYNFPLALSLSVSYFLFLLRLCSDLPHSLISARIRSKDLTPETQLPHWAKCAAHKLQYPSKAFPYSLQPSLPLMLLVFLCPLLLYLIHTLCLLPFLTYLSLSLSHALLFHHDASNNVR